jgi:hypothetical protein
VSRRFGGARSDHPSATVVVVVEVLDVELIVESGTVVVLVVLVVVDDVVLVADDEDVVVVGTSVYFLPPGVLTNTANNLPDGRVGWFAAWRTGAEPLSIAAFRMLDVATTA